MRLTLDLVIMLGKNHRGEGVGSVVGLSDLLPDGPSVVPGLRNVAAALDQLSYTPDAVRALLGAAGDIPTTPADLVIYQRRLAANPGALADVIATFLLGRELAIERLAAALGNAPLAVLVEAGAVVERDGLGVPAVSLIPHGELWVASDLRPSRGASIDRLHVTGINAPANLLASLTVHRDGGRCLDVGTGCGIQSLLMARHGGRVVATDVNPRALAFAAFNAGLNGIDTIEFRAGSLLEPVAGEHFDVIVSNPPYVISPDDDFVFRDSGGAPGALCAELVRDVPAHLARAGYASILASWPIVAEGSWSDVPRSWLSEGCRAWLLQFSDHDALAHARVWNAPLAVDGDLAGFETAVDRWADYLTEEGIERIGYGAVLMMRHDSDAAVVRADEVRGGQGNAGTHIQRVFAAVEALAGIHSDALAELTVHVPTEHHLERNLSFAAGGWQAGNAVITLSEGVGIEVTLDPLMTEVLLRVTGGMTVHAAAAAAGELAGVPPEHLDDLVVAAGAMVRDLLSMGIVVAGPIAS
jgi:methylase of polypeptide subunit release factors